MVALGRSNIDKLVVISQDRQYFTYRSWLQQTGLLYPGGGGGGGHKVLYRGLRPEVQLVTLSYTILTENVPLSYIFYWKGYPFHTPI